MKIDTRNCANHCQYFPPGADVRELGCIKCLPCSSSSRSSFAALPALPASPLPLFIAFIFSHFLQFFVCFLLLVARCVHQSLTARTTWPYPPQSRENWTPQLQNRAFFWRTFRLRTSQTHRVREAWPRRVLKRLLF